MGVRTLLKGVAERVLVAAGAPAVLRAVSGESRVIVNYHNVVPDGESPGGDRSLHLPRSDFLRQLDLLAETHTIVDLATVITEDAVDAGSRLAAVTFDDGYRGALTVGLPELASRSAPCTVFVAPALLGADRLWWDALTPRGAEGLDDHLREEALSEARGRSEEVYQWAERRGLTAHSQPWHAGLGDEAELRDAAAGPGVSLGAHGWTHADLTRLNGDELEEELERPLAWLRERFPDRTLLWLSLPYGRCTDHVVARAREAGYRGVLDLSRRSLPRAPGSPPAVVPRKNVPAGISPEGFVLRVAGL